MVDAVDVDRLVAAVGVGAIVDVPTECDVAGATVPFGGRVEALEGLRAVVVVEGEAVTETSAEVSTVPFEVSEERVSSVATVVSSVVEKSLADVKTVPVASIVVGDVPVGSSVVSGAETAVVDAPVAVAGVVAPDEGTSLGTGVMLVGGILVELCVVLGEADWPLEGIGAIDDWGEGGDCVVSGAPVEVAA